MLSYFVTVFWLLFFNADWLISYQDQVNCWMGFFCKISLSVAQIRWLSYYSSRSSWLFIGYLLQDFSSNHPNLVITFLFGNYSMRVNCCEYLYLALTQDRVTNFLRLSLLISYWLLGFVFAPLLEVWIELLKNWDRSLISHQIQVNCLLVIFCLRFLFQSSKFGHHISVWQL